MRLEIACGLCSFNPGKTTDSTKATAHDTFNVPHRTLITTRRGRYDTASRPRFRSLNKCAASQPIPTAAECSYTKKIENRKYRPGHRNTRMDDSDVHNAFHDEAPTRGIEAFTRKVTTTASHLAGHGVDSGGSHYHNAMGQVHKQLARPGVQRRMFSMTRTTPTDLVRSKFSTAEIQSRALSYLSDDMLQNIPEDENAYSLFQGFQATFPELTDDGKRHRRRASRGRKMLEDSPSAPNSPQHLHKLKKGRSTLMHELEMLSIRKNMASSEIREIDNKIANLSGMRRIILERLAGLEQEEALLEHDIVDMEGRIEVAQVLVDEAESIAAAAATPTRSDEDDLVTDQDVDEFMSKSVYEKIPSASSTPSRSKRHKTIRRKSMPILHEHFDPGFNIREIKAHTEQITAVDFDVPFGTMVSASLDDTVKVWDLNAGRCIGSLEGHTASVRALQVEDNILVTGSADATPIWTRR
ncbi:hypothetical protein NUW58_g10075 [Xylaria curta]|uniref:Uncharacterized protein n=1 Tax=Xylaria curta TaxID=42375 RepID=A0ACC1MQ17_9PEZI|nr:hypothetical protein NUW58_g10075 [Xylaria curta]